MTAETVENSGETTENDCVGGNCPTRGEEKTVAELVEKFKEREDSERLIARWQRPMPLS